MFSPNLRIWWLIVNFSRIKSRTLLLNWHASYCEIHCTYLNVCMDTTRTLHCILYRDFIRNFCTHYHTTKGHSIKFIVPTKLNLYVYDQCFPFLETFFIDFSLNWIQNTVDSPFNDCEGCLFAFIESTNQFLRKIASI